MNAPMGVNAVHWTVHASDVDLTTSSGHSAVQASFDSYLAQLSDNSTANAAGGSL